MSRQTLQTLCGYLVYCEELTVKGTGGREPITIEKQLLITLWYIGSLDPIVRIADKFGVSESSVIRNSFCDGGVQRCNPNYIIADGAYPLQRWLLTPFRDNGLLNQEQRNYNHMLSANRVVIERSFGLLKGRFRRLQYLETLTVETAVYIATGCTVVHNVCLLNNDRIEDFLQNDQQIDNMQVMHLNENEAEGAIKRNIIARNLARQ